MNKKKPVLAVVILLIIVAGCFACGFFGGKDPAYPDLRNCNLPPGKEFLFGTDPMGRDVFSMIWHGGRVSLFIGAVSTIVSTAIAMFYGALSGWAPKWGDRLLMRLLEIFLSIPNLLAVIFLQAVLGKATIVSISFVIGMTDRKSVV